MFGYIFLSISMALGVALLLRLARALHKKLSQKPTSAEAANKFAKAKKPIARLFVLSLIICAAMFYYDYLASATITGGFRLEPADGRAELAQFQKEGEERPAYAYINRDDEIYHVQIIGENGEIEPMVIVAEDATINMISGNGYITWNTERQVATLHERDESRYVFFKIFWRAPERIELEREIYETIPQGPFVLNVPQDGFAEAK